MKLPSMLALLSALCLAATGARAAAPAAVHIGLMSPFTTANANNSQAYVDGMHMNISSYPAFKQSAINAAMRYQIGVINANAGLLPSTTIVAKLVDDQSNAALASAAVGTLLAGGAQAVLSGSGSSVSGAVQPALAPSATAMLSAFASSSVLANKTSYPTFTRVCQNDALQGQALAYVAKVHFGWANVALLYTADSYGKSGAAAIVATAQTLGLNIVNTQMMPAYGPISVTVAPLAAMQQSGAKVFIFFGHSADWVNVAAQAAQIGIFNSTNVWLLSDSTIGASSITAAQRASWAGAIGVSVDAGSSSTVYQTWVSNFVARSQVGTIEEEQWTGAAADVGFYTVFAADAVNVLAQALHSLIEVQMLSNFTNAQLAQAMLAVSFNGITGPVSFNANGDRNGLTFVLVNLQGSSWVKIGTIDPAQETFTPIAGAGMPIWISGNTAVPSDGFTPSSTSSSTGSTSSSTGTINGKVAGAAHALVSWGVVAMLASLVLRA